MREEIQAKNLKVIYVENSLTDVYKVFKKKKRRIHGFALLSLCDIFIKILTYIRKAYY